MKVYEIYQITVRTTPQSGLTVRYGYLPYKEFRNQAEKDRFLRDVAKAWKEDSNQKKGTEVILVEPTGMRYTQTSKIAPDFVEPKNKNIVMGGAMPQEPGKGGR